MAIDKKLLEDLYHQQRLSMAEIAERLGCSQNKVAYWMGKYSIERRDISEAIYLWQNPDGDPFAIQPLATDESRALFSLGIGLYIGEGKKAKRGDVSIANTDPRVIRAFLGFLVEICGVSRESLFAWINVFDDVDLEEVQRYWEAVTDLPRSQFQKPTVRQSRGGSYQTESEYGTLSVGFYSTKLFDIIQRWCAQSLEKYE